ncbi:hypothetical protein DVH05_008488 [Phytophthora capsici]|nr:hypothetical protein DVH05_008488 [Phytophthora capsici]
MGLVLLDDVLEMNKTNCCEKEKVMGDSNPAVLSTNVHSYPHGSDWRSLLNFPPKMDIDLTYDSDSVPATPAPRRYTCRCGRRSCTPSRDLPYHLFDAEKLDIGYFEVNGLCFILPYLNKLTFGIGTTTINFYDISYGGTTCIGVSIPLSRR